MSVAITLSQLLLAGLCGLLAWRIYSLCRSVPADLADALPPQCKPPQSAYPRRLPDETENIAHSRSLGKAARGPGQYIKADRVAKAQIFAGIQMLDAKMRGVKFRGNGGGGPCEKLAAAYLTGAARAISFEMGATEREALDVTAFLLTHNLSFKAQAALSAVEEMTRDENALASFRSGLEAAETWLNQKYVPDRFSLFRALSDNAFV